MNTNRNLLQSLALTTVLLSTTALVSAADTGPSVATQESTSKLLTAHFQPRHVVKIEAGDFHFVPGQPAPIHTHVAPAVGYVAKGEIIYQVEGEKPQILREGDAFYEPAGPRILRFDNASATEEAIFIDFNLQQTGEPFIVFEEKPTDHIDRRKLPTVDLDGKSIEQVDIFVSEIEPNARKKLNTRELVLAYVAEGIVNVKLKGKGSQRLVAGKSFSLMSDNSRATIVNDSKEVPAKVVSFYLR